MAKPRVKKAKDNPEVSGLLTALKFCEPAVKEIGSPNQTHIRLVSNWAVAFEGVIAMGHKIDSDIAACPHAVTLIRALTKCDGPTQITQLGDGRLSIQCGKFRTFVPCLTDDLLGTVTPDAPCANITPAVVNSLKIVGTIAQENAPRIMLASVLLRSGSAVATDGTIIMESWHGVDLPPITVPKAFISVLSKIEKPAIYFGFSPSSVTFYFDDQSWIRTQVYSEKWPEVDRVLNTPANAWPIPAGLVEGLAKITELVGEDGRVYFGLKSVRTDMNVDAGASCEIEGSLPDNLCFNIDDLEELLGHAKAVDFQCGEQKMMAVFYGDNFRGMLMGIKATINNPAPEPATINPNNPTPAWSQPTTAWGQVAQPAYRNPHADDDIPF